MEPTMNHRLIQLSRGEVIERPDARGTTLRIGRGSLWVTQERDRRDVVLTAGDAWTVERDGLTVAEARGDASLLLAGGNGGNASLRAPRPRWRERIATWLRVAVERLERPRFVPYF
jgi:hypothetical protein